MIRILTAAALAALTAGAAHAGAADTQAALNACASGYPDGKRIAAGLTAAGFQDMGVLENGGQSLHMFASADGKTYAGTQGTGGVQCMIVEHKLAVRKAEGMAQGLVKQMPGAAELPSPKGAGLEVSKTWAGMMANKMTVLMVVKSYAFKDAKGAALLMVAQ